VTAVCCDYRFLSGLVFLLKCYSQIEDGMNF
jgi:hypothetical protein